MHIRCRFPALHWWKRHFCIAHWEATGINKVCEHHCSLHHQRILATAKGQWVLNQSQLDLVREGEWQIDPQTLIFSIKTRKSAWEMRAAMRKTETCGEFRLCLFLNAITSGIKSVTDFTVAIWFLRWGYSSQINMSTNQDPSKRKRWLQWPGFSCEKNKKLLLRLVAAAWMLQCW